ncbi:MAG: metallophosphoesterase, partial [Nanoarchaeota archaeon]|nr:metallophosphoesterase [Nanoarchaeota archaeon]
MKFLIIGDPHGTEKVFEMPIEEADAIIIPGDLGKADLMRDLHFNDFDYVKGDWKGPTPKEKIMRAEMEAFESTIKILDFLNKHNHVFIVFGNVESTDTVTAEKNRKYGLKLPYLEKEISRMK